MEYDVVVVGGGSSGLIAAREIAREGYDVCVIEEHQEVGYPVKCSGLFSVSGLKALDLKLDDSIISTTIKGGRFFSPGGFKLEAYSDVERARVVERKMFDKFLGKEAVRAGAQIKLKTKVTGFEIDDIVKIRVIELGKDVMIKSKLLIGADGLRSNVARWVGLPTSNKVVACAQMEVDSVDVEEDIAELYFGREYAPNFYAWVLPKGDVYEVGTGIRDGKTTPVEYLKKFIQKHPIASKRIKSRSMLEVNIGGIPVDGYRDTVSDRIMIVGDAAGHTKASTGGGVITGGIAARIAGRASIMALEQEDFSKNFLKREYENKWKGELGVELDAHLLVRQLLDSLSDAQMDEMFKIAIEENLVQLMVKYQDTDRPSKFVREILKKERLLEWIQDFLDVSESQFQDS